LDARSYKGDPFELGFVIPCRNSASVIAGTISEIEKSLSSKDELIVVENGSTEETKRVLSEIRGYCTSKARLKILLSDQGPGNAPRIGVMARESKRLPITADDLSFGVSDLHSSYLKFATYKDEYLLENWKSGKLPKD
jgi:glycosyltransferase involved in cell wall biosynthesis